MTCLHHRCISYSRRLHTLSDPDSLPISSSHLCNEYEHHEVAIAQAVTAVLRMVRIHSRALRERRIPSTKCLRLASSCSSSVTLYATHTRTPAANRIRRHDPQTLAVLRRVMALIGRTIAHVLRSHDCANSLVFALHVAFKVPHKEHHLRQDAALGTTYSAPEHVLKVTNKSPIATCASNVQLSSPSTRACATSPPKPRRRLH